MTKDEALQMCLEYIETDAHERKYVRHAIKAALEAKDEPKCVVIVEVFGKDWRLEYMSLPIGRHKLYAQQYFYTTPQPQREWVGLTDDEMQQACYEAFSYDPYVIAKAIEAKLKERNHD